MRAALLLALSFVLALAARGQGGGRPEGVLTDGQIVHDVWTVQAGLPVNHANGLLQTPDGYLWMATFDGLVRFDGVRFAVYRPGNTPALPSSRFFGLARGLGATFWGLSQEGPVLVDRQGFHAFPLAFRSNSRVLADGDSVLWVASAEGLFRYEGDSLRAVAPSRFGGRALTALLRTRDGSIWAAAVEGVGKTALWRFDGRWRRQADPGIGPLDVLFEDAHGTLWAGGRGLARLSGGTFEPVEAFAPERFIPPDRPEAWPERQPYVNALHDADDGGVWATTPWGPYWTDGEAIRPLLEAPLAGPALPLTFATCPDGRAWMAYGSRFFRDGRLRFEAPLSAMALLCDREGNLWAATSGQGLHRFREPLLHTVSAAEGLGFRNVAGLFEDETGALWIGTDRWRYARLKDGRITNGTFPDGLSAGAAGVGLAARDGTLWIGRSRCLPADRTPDGGCARFVPEAEAAPPGDVVHAIAETRDGAVWLGSESGLSRFADGRWTHFRPGTPTGRGLPEHLVRFLLEARDGTLWLGTFGGGVARYVPDGTGGHFEAFTTADGLSSDNVRWIHEGDDGALWIATEDRGLNRLDPRTGAVTPIRAADGLYDDNLHSILDDGHGRFWFSTNRGIFWVAKAGLDAFVRGEAPRIESVAYTERDGMRNREANGSYQTSALKARDGRLWFATQDGVVVVDPAAVGQRGLPPPVLVEEVRTRGAVVAPEAGGGVALPADARAFTVAYTAPSFAAPERVRFRYRLEGFHDDWVDAEGRREAVYTNVPPGHYTFRVVASNGDGVWNDEGATLAVRVAPFFWETWAFDALVLLALAGVFAGGVRWRLARGRRREALLEAQVVERTEALALENRRTEAALLDAEAARREAEAAAATIEAQRQELAKLDEAKTRFFTNVSHEFRTPLTLTIGPLEDLQRGARGALPTPARASVDLALRNSRRLLRLINQLLDIAKLEAGHFALDRRPLDLGPYVEALALAFTPLAERRHVAFTLDLPEAPVVAMADAEVLEGVVVNLLSNAFKFTPAGGRIAVAVAAEGGAACLSVADDGPGIPEDVLPHLFERFYQVGESASDVQAGTGIGLALAREIAELHGGTLTVESEAGKGSRFAVALPLAEATDDEGATPEAVPLRPRRHPDGLGGEDALPDEGEDRTTVLVVDDNADIRRYVRSHLEGAYRVVEAADGEAGLAMARRHLPDCVVSDVMMPRLDGFGLVRALRADPATDFLPVVLLTAKATEDDKLGGLGEGADDYLTKPFSVRELRARVENLIAQRRRLRLRFGGDGAPAEAPPDGPTLGAADAAFLAEVRAAVEAALSDEDFSVEALAEAVGQSRSNLHRRLREIAGQAPTAFVREVRLAHAARLLAEGAGNVSEVAYAVGFKSVSHFSRVFGARYGVAPSAYRARRDAPADAVEAPPSRARA